MANEPISEQAYLQLSDSEKAGYREEWELHEPNTNTYFKAPTQPGEYVSITFDQYIHFHWPIKVRRVYIPLPNEKES